MSRLLSLPQGPLQDTLLAADYTTIYNFAEANAQAFAIISGPNSGIFWAQKYAQDFGRPIQQDLLGTTLGLNSRQIYLRMYIQEGGVSYGGQMFLSPFILYKRAIQKNDAKLQPYFLGTIDKLLDKALNNPQKYTSSLDTDQFVDYIKLLKKKRDLIRLNQVRTLLYSGIVEDTPVETEYIEAMGYLNENRDEYSKDVSFIKGAIDRAIESSSYEDALSLIQEKIDLLQVNEEGEEDEQITDDLGNILEYVYEKDSVDLGGSILELIPERFNDDFDIFVQRGKIESGLTQTYVQASSAVNPILALTLAVKYNNIPMVDSILSQGLVTQFRRLSKTSNPAIFDIYAKYTSPALVTRYFWILLRGKDMSVDGFRYLLATYHPDPITQATYLDHLVYTYLESYPQQTLAEFSRIFSYDEFVTGGFRDITLAIWMVLPSSDKAASISGLPSVESVLLVDALRKVPQPPINAGALLSSDYK